MTAVETLENDDAAVSVKSVREVIGSGSYTTISKHLQEIEEERSRPLTAPDPIRALLTETADHLWTEAVKTASQQFDAERSKLQAAVETAEKDSADAKSEIERLESVEAEAKKTIEARDARITAFQTELENASAETAEARRQAAASDARAQTLEKIVEKFSARPNDAREPAKGNLPANTA